MLLTLYTPTFRRPRQLARCRASVVAQTRQDLLHQVVVEDTVGIGVAGMFRDIANHHAHIAGDYVYFLSDDDVLADADVVAELADFAAAHPDADVIMARAQIGEYTFPLAPCWQAAPRESGVTLANWIVKNAVWKSVPYGGRYEGDFDFIAECWRRGLTFAWWDRLICRADGWGRGAPER